MRSRPRTTPPTNGGGWSESPGFRLFLESEELGPRNVVQTPDLAAALTTGFPVVRSTPFERDAPPHSECPVAGHLEGDLRSHSPRAFPHTEEKFYDQVVKPLSRNAQGVLEAMLGASNRSKSIG